MQDTAASSAAKVPQATLGFWVLKILATTLGETAGDAVTMSWLGETTARAATGVSGYLLGTALFAVVFAVAVTAQVRARGFHPALYWAAIVASTTVGTTLADFATRALGIGYTGGATLLLALLLGTLWVWKRDQGSIAVASVRGGRAEAFYWLAITFSQTLGTALGDWVADTAGAGYGGGIVVFGAALLAVVLAWRFTRVSRTALFWLAFILTRPLGAVLGDWMDKPVAAGGLDISRYTASLVLVGLLAAGVALLPQRAARQAH